MLQPISAIKTNQQYYQTNKTTLTQPQISVQNLDLPGAEVGRAIAVQRNVSFKNLAMPVEVTDRYNKKVEGKDHLDLPNIHVYEYPDTNLRVILDVIKTTNSELPDKLEKLQILYYIRNNLSTAEKNDQKNKIIIEKANEELKNISENITVDPVITSQNAFLGYSSLYGEDTLKNAEKCNKAILNLTFEDFKIQDYYNQVKKNISMDVYITVSKEYYEENKNEIFNNLNQGIDLKLFNKSDTATYGEVFNDILRDLSIGIINAYKGDSKEDILELDLQDILNETKNLYKKNLEKSLASENYMTLMRNMNLAYYQVGAFKVYEIIDSITEQNIKDYIRGKINETAKSSNSI